MEEPRELSASEFVEAVDAAADTLGWSGSYVNLASASVGAAFRAAGLDEKTDKLGFSVAEMGRVSDRILEYARETGMVEKTGRTYASTWRRMSAVAARWAQAVAEAGRDGTPDFAKAFEPLKDQRKFRHEQNSYLAELVHRRGPPMKRPEGARMIAVETRSGPVEVMVPEGFDSRSAVEVIAKLTEYIQKRGPAG